ncbi:hypothetical protein PSTT_05552 [Puccinia striiformis]|uniref:Transposase domain-containing protein n=1 Tax=Puccinia striiformis TaxID=27350 RepID=A0A2S4VNC8_9BASI|nr:hypothetical protein PSTT_05552 [Puccinia striiformis]
MKYCNLNPTIYQTLCCPGCFKIYPNHSTDFLICNYRITARSKTCNSPLFDQNGHCIRQYSMQSLQEWLKVFLQRRKIEDLLQESVTYSNPQPETCAHLWDGSIWYTFQDAEGRLFHQRFGNLSFGIYVDWFNPMGNKISGKHHSVGAIILFCLSLPVTVSHRYQLQNLFFVGITPGPSEPTVLQINNVLLLLVEELHTLWQKGIEIKTPKYPRGLLVRVALIAAVCDLPAIRKLIGYASHSANKFCLFCYLSRDNNQCLNYGSWEVRTIDWHREEAQAWKDATTHSQRDELLQKFGVQWSILNELPYWNPI